MLGRGDSFLAEAVDEAGNLFPEGAVHEVLSDSFACVFSEPIPEFTVIFQGHHSLSKCLHIHVRTLYACDSVKVHVIHSASRYSESYCWFPEVHAFSKGNPKRFILSD